VVQIQTQDNGMEKKKKKKKKIPTNSLFILEAPVTLREPPWVSIRWQSETRL